MASSKAHENRRKTRQSLIEFQQVREIINRISDVKDFIAICEGHIPNVNTQSEADDLENDIRNMEQEVDSLLNKLSVRY